MSLQTSCCNQGSRALLAIRKNATLAYQTEKLHPLIIGLSSKH